ncbi:hypothetical protein ACIQWA_19430 [Kitasatospora sp. NPDC098652]|uniref:hypothetical protein n=1 Tax=Kitasatospora sp. NPDC098652 TaxID=3364095 RepID=UPI003823EA2F
MTTPYPAPPPPRRPAASPWAASPKPTTERATGRLRRIVEGLPDWEPLPPGEVTVRRPGSGL